MTGALKENVDIKEKYQVGVRSQSTWGVTLWTRFLIL